MTFEGGLDEEFAVPDVVLPVVSEMRSFTEEDIIPLSGSTATA